MCAYHAYTEQANSALCDVYLEVVVSLGSDFHSLNGSVCLILLKGSLNTQFLHQLGFSKFIWAPEYIFSWISTCSDDIVLVISLGTQIVICLRMISLLPASLTIQHIPASCLTWLPESDSL